MEYAFKLYEKNHKLFIKGRDSGKVATDVQIPASHHIG